MDKKRLLSIILVVLITASAVAVYFLYINPLGPIDVTVGAFLSDPARYNDREVRVEGSLCKSWFLTRLIHNLSDAGAGVAVTAQVVDLDAYIGLRVVVEGRFRYRPNIVGGPNLIVEAATVRVKQGSTQFFLQWERTGGIAGLHQFFIIDHNSTAFIIDWGRTLLEKSLNASLLQSVTRIITENGFLTLQRERYEARQDTADYFTYSLKVVRASGSQLESKAVTWVDEWASKEPLPLNLTRLQSQLEPFIIALLPPPSGGTLLVVNIDKDRVLVGEYITVSLKITNVGSENQRYDVSPPAFDMLLYDENGTLKAKWSEGQFFPEVIIFRTLAPGESYEEEFFWNLYRFDNVTYGLKPLSPGTYYLQGVFRSLPNLQASRIRVEIRPRPTP